MRKRDLLVSLSERSLWYLVLSRTRKKRGNRSWGRRQRRERPLVLISLTASGLWRGGAAFRCYLVSIGKLITPDVLPYNNMLINPLGLLWSGSQAVSPGGGGCRSD